MNPSTHPWLLTTTVMIACATLSVPGQEWSSVDAPGTDAAVPFDALPGGGAIYLTRGGQCVTLDAKGVTTSPNGLPLPLVGTTIAAGRGGAFFVMGDTNTTVSADGLSWALTGRFVAKYNPARRLLWAENLPAEASTNNPSPALAATSDGGVVCLAPRRTVSSVIRLGEDGQAMWSQRFTNLELKSIAVDRADAVLVAANFSATTSVGETTLTPKGGGDAALIKLATVDGAPAWAVALGGPLADRVVGCRAGAADSVLVAGTFVRKTQVGSRTMDAVGGAGMDIFVAQFSSAGQLEWATSLGGLQDDSVRALASDDDGNAYLLRETVGASGPSVVKLTVAGTVAWERVCQTWTRSPYLLDGLAATPSGDLVSHGLVYGSFGYVYGTVFQLRTTNTERDEATPVNLSMYAGLSIAGRTGRSYRIEFRPGVDDATPWQSITNVLLPTSPMVWIDPDSHRRDTGFYRAILNP